LDLWGPFFNECRYFLLKRKKEKKKTAYGIYIYIYLKKNIKKKTAYSILAKKKREKRKGRLHIAFLDLLKIYLV
jgi:hypothetical protein